MYRERDREIVVVGCLQTRPPTCRVEAITTVFVCYDISVDATECKTNKQQKAQNINNIMHHGYNQH